MVDKKQLQKNANEMRKLIVEGIYAAKSGHPGGSLSICDIMSVLFFDKMNTEGANLDRFVLSKGHAAPALYAALSLKGHFPAQEMKNLRNINSFLQGHPCMNKVPGVDMSTGSLGQGLSAANGMAINAKYKKQDYRVYCICGDGELQEGQIWEAAMTAAHYKLDNLTVFIDNNGLQIDGSNDEVMSLGNISDKFKSFGFHIIEIDGHDIEAIQSAVDTACATKGKPTAIICKTIKGKGVSFMENQVGFHGAAPSDAQYEIAMKELGEVL